MLIEQQPAYVLHGRAYRETSLLLECLTRDYGRVGVVARGVRGQRPKLSRSQLEPFQALHVDFSLRGELATLRAAEPCDAPRRLRGDALLGGLYINELVVRLSARHDAQPGLFEAYRRTLERLPQPGQLAWALRRFERDLLAELGYGLQLRYEAESGEPIQAQAIYRYLPEQGAVPAAHGPGTVRGQALLALEADQCPSIEDLRDLRKLMRVQIGHHLGGGQLNAWSVLRATRTPR
ncbi:DNA repair protein RecO [Oleiagrimonas sp. C23AA]|uniref:DNA repair protein RecO n=1 Tax=Oleiagrimonas sp. C23AA TaxID=2719047 RepID=UPI0014234409|nr:DNA repair protein RecO [Oleiagrimonas sp. C23AA]NII10397.1 DNA repair protein RecO [Oleiagrimonas sp. C23AA]